MKFWSLFLVLAFACNNPKKEIKIKRDSESSIKKTVPLTNIQHEISEQRSEDRGIEIASIDTIKKDEFIIYIQPQKKPNFKNYYPDEDKRDLLVKDIPNYFEKATIIERYLKGEFDKIFTSTDSLLTIKLNDNQEINLPKWDPKRQVGYTFNHYLPDTDYALLNVHYPEGAAYMLINRKNGFKKVICGLPHFSPDKKQILTFSLDLEAGYSFNGLEYYQIKADTLAKCFALELKGWGPSKINWTSNNTVDIERTFFTIKDYKQIFHTENSTFTIARK